MSNFTVRTLTAVALLITLSILAYPLLAQSAEPCQVISGGTDELSGDKVSVTICKDDIGGQATETSTPVGTPTRTPTPTATRTPGAPPPSSTGCILVCPDEVASLPTDNAAYESVRNLASGSGTPDLSNQDSDVNAIVLAQALVYARTGDESYREKVITAIRSIVQNQSENGGRTLALGRELGAYVAAAEIIDLRSYNPMLNGEFMERISALRTETLDSRTLISTCEDRANNWGTHACAARAAVGMYIGDVADVQRTYNVVCGWAGERNRYADFKYGALDWQADPANPVGINPVGATKQGHIIDGALPEEMRRAGAFQWPPAKTNYVWGGMAGAAFAMEILSNAGYDAWECADKAMLRAARFAYDNGFIPSGDDVSIPPLINAAYGTSFAFSGYEASKNVCCTAWLFGGATVVSDVLAATERTVTADSLTDLQREVETASREGWVATGEPYTLDTEDDGQVYARDMARGD